jgi:beta-lactamase regulating signal transducer with metallopeptidase domain/peroxiredoxin
MNDFVDWLLADSSSLIKTATMAVLRITVLLSATWVLHGLLSRRNPRWRIMLWRGCCLGIAAIVIAPQAKLQLELPLLPASPPSAEVQQTGAAPQGNLAGLPPNQTPTHDLENPPMGLSAAKDVRSKQTHVDDLDRFETEAQATSQLPAAVPFPWARMIAVLWGVGVVALSVRWLLGVLRLRLMVNSSSPAAVFTVEEAKRAANWLGYSGPISIKQSDAVASPCSVGVFRPVILLPTTAGSALSGEELRASLAHELSHLEGRDLVWNQVLSWTTILLWFHPLAWRIRLAHADDCDQLCDAKAACYLNDAQRYCRILATIALRVAGDGEAAALSMARPSSVRRRIEAIQRGLAAIRIPRWRLAMASAMVLIGIGVIGTINVKRLAAEPVNDQAAAADDSKQSNTAGNEEDVEKIQLSVISATTKQPLADVTFEFNGNIGGERLKEKITTDQEGKAAFKFAKGETVNNLWFTADKPSFVPVHYQWRSESTKIELPKTLELILTDGQLVGGQVVDADGKPIANVDVNISMPITWPQLDSWVFTAVELTTDEEGRWQWEGSPQDTQSLSVRAEHPDFMKGGLQVSLGKENVLTLKQGLQVQGKILDASGKPIKGAAVRLGFDRFGTDLPSGSTNDQGEFTLKNCQAGKSLVTAQADGFAPTLQEVSVSEETPLLTLQLEAPSHLEVEVVDLAGEPISGAMVATDTWRGYRSLEFREDTNDQGLVSWKSAPADTILCDIMKSGYMAARHTPIAPKDGKKRVVLQPVLQVSGKVTDAKTGKAIEEFELRNGFLFTNSDRTHWSGDRGIVFDGGQYSYKFDEPMEGRLLQVVASGYLPKTSRVFESTEGTVTFDFALEPGSGASGLVVTPEGKAAVGAEVGWATPEKRAFMSGGRFDRRQNRAEVTKTDERGHFEFPPQGDEPAIIFIFHESGYAEIDGEKLSTPQRIELKPWGKIHGRSILGDQPDIGREVTYTPNSASARQHQVMWDFGYRATTDANGEFEFDRAVPGLGQVSRVVITKFIRGQQHAPGWQTPIEVLPNETAEITIGGTGRPVVGQVALDRQPGVDIDWTANNPASLQRKRDQQAGGDVLYVRMLGPIDRSGKFSIPDVPPGEYELKIAVNNPPTPDACGAGEEIGQAKIDVTVPPRDSEQPDKPFDVGSVTAVLFDTLDAGEAAPEFVAEGVSGDPVRLSDYRGKLIVLDFWATWCRPCVAEMPTFKRIKERFGDDDRFVLIGLSCDNTADIAKRFVEKQDLSWIQGAVGGTYGQIPRDYTVRALPATFLIGPDGKIMARDLRGEELERAVAAALEDEALFTNASLERPARFPVTHFDEVGSETTMRPALFILNNVDPSFEKGIPHHDELIAIDRDGKELWKYAGLNQSETVGGTHRVAIDRERDRVYVLEDVDDRLLAFDLAGSKIWQMEKIESSALAVDPTSGNIWVTGGRDLKSGQTVVFDPEGQEIAAYPVRGVDIVFDSQADAVWLAGYDLIKLSSSGEVLFREPVGGWCYSSIDLNRQVGGVWVAEREHPDVAKSKNRLWLRNADGSVRREIALGDESPFVVGCEPNSGDAIFSSFKGPSQRVGATGEPAEFSPLAARNIAFGGVGEDDVWVVADEGVSRLNAAGEGELIFAFPQKTSQAWIAVE